MTPEQFAYWLQGFVELQAGAQPNPEQWRSICEHLQTVFYKVTPPVQPFQQRDSFPPVDPVEGWMIECRSDMTSRLAEVTRDPFDTGVRFCGAADPVATALGKLDMDAPVEKLTPEELKEFQESVQREQDRWRDKPRRSVKRDSGFRDKRGIC